jgi:general stress protein 26
MEEDVKTLTGEEAIEKIKEMAEKKVCMFTTYEDFKMVARPMATSGIDDNGDLWFISNKSSHKNQQIGYAPVVDLIYMDAGKSHYLVLNGNAQVVEDREKARELWNPLDKAWFKEGVDDPDLTLIKVVPTEGHYWDTKNGKLLTMISIAISALTGKAMKEGVEGDVLP